MRKSVMLIYNLDTNSDFRDLRPFRPLINDKKTKRLKVKKTKRQKDKKQKDKKTLQER